MNTKTIGVVVALAVVVVFGVYMYNNNVVDLPVTTQETFDGQNSSFVIGENTFTLINGVVETESAPGSSSKVVTRYFGNVAVGDLTGDGKEDIAYLVTQEPGGTGIFYYAVVAMKTDTGYKTTNAFYIGDRISPQNNLITAQELHVNYAERRAGEPMITPPSVGAVKLLKVTPEGVLNGLMQ